MNVTSSTRASVRPLLPGVVVALLVAMVGYVVHRQVSVVSPHVVAVAIGIMGATFGRIEEVFKPGLRFCARRVLRAGIVLLGFRLSLGELGALGPKALGAVVVVVVATFFGTQWLARRLGLTRSLGLLMANTVAPFYLPGAVDRIAATWAAVLDTVQAFHFTFTPDARAVETCQAHVARLGV